MNIKEIRPKVVYIMGFGHSGSTLLDIILSNHPQIVGAGELKKLFRFGWNDNTDRRCSCGAPRHECTFWSEVYAQWSAKVGAHNVQEYVDLQDRFERSKPIHNLRWVWQNEKQPSAQFSAYASMTAAIYEAIQEISGQSIIVDSSKTPLRAYGLLLGGRVDLYLIHLIRDGRGVVWSLMKPKPREKNPKAGRPKDYPPKASWRTTFDWVQINLQSQWVAKKAPAQKTIQMQYERLVQEPSRSLNQIGRLIGEDMSALGSKLLNKHPLTVSHIVAGNSLRMDSAVVLREDSAWRESLPIRDEKTFWLVGGWLAQKYGYQNLNLRDEAGGD